MNLISTPLQALLSFCYQALGNYALAIILFTLLTKVILFPITLWTHRNSIRMVELMPALNRAKLKYYGDKDAIAEETQRLYKEYRYHPLLSTIPMILQIVLLMGVVGAVKSLLGNSDSVLTLIPAENGGWTWIMPLLAGLAAAALSLAQSRISPLQREQSLGAQLFTGGISVGISLFLGAYVMVGVAIYWIAGNLFTILQQLLMNWIIPPEKYVDYPALEESKKELAAVESLSGKVSPEDKRREKEDYKRFFSVANKHLVFYSEKSGFYKYFQSVIEYLLSHSNVTIHYVTSDPKDQIFTLAKTQPHIHPYYIGENRLITLFMKMDADIVVMTMPDLENFHIKRSYVRKDIEYIYMVHGMTSTNITVRKGAYDNYDTVFCVGQHQVDEIRETEAMYHLKPKTLVPCGYGLLDRMIEDYKKQPTVLRDKKQVLVAPSWQEGNILESCIDELIEELYGKYLVTVRPHPEFIKRFPEKMKAILERHSQKSPEWLEFEMDFSSNQSIFQADVLITDWSSIAHDFAYTTLKPVLFINTPMKIINPEYVRYTHQPTDITLRNVIGRAVELNQIHTVKGEIGELLERREEYRNTISHVVEQYIFSVGNSGKVGGGYILDRLVQKKAERKELQ